MKQVKGSVSVFLAITITLVLSFCMVLIESARENTLLLRADICLDTGVQSLMAEYHRMLWEEYDLFYVDCSYGMPKPDYDLTKSHLKGFVSQNLGYDIGSWLRLDYKDAEITNVLLATDCSGMDFFLQAVEASEASVGISYIEQVISWFEQAEITYASESDFIKGRQEVQSAIDDINGTEIEVKEAVWGEDAEGQSVLIEAAEYETVDINNPLDKILSGNLLVRQVIGAEAAVSENRVDLNLLASHRSLTEGTVSEKKDVYTLWNKAFFCKYIMDHFSCFTDKENGTESGLEYEMEYLIGGRAGDAQNMEIVVAELLAFREVDNYLELIQDEAVRLEAHSIAAATSAILVPWLEPVLYQAILLYWAYENSVQDLQMLFSGNEIPLLKCIPGNIVSEFTLSYKEYLLLLLMMQGSKDLSMKAIDVIEVNLRNEQDDFRMDGCISKANIKGTFEDTYGKKYIITKTLQYY